MVKTFTLRVDLESDKGIKKGLPKLLDLLKKHHIKASFYIPMGGESNILDLLRYRGRLRSAGEREIKVFSLLDKIRMILFPRDFVKSNKKIVRLLDDLPTLFVQWVIEYNNFILLYNKYIMKEANNGKTKLYDTYKCKAIWNLPRL